MTLASPQAAGEAAKERYGAIFQHAREGVFVASTTGEVRLVNPAFARLLGYEDPQEFMASPAARLDRILDRADHGRLHRSLEQGEGMPMELPLFARDGTLVWCSLSAQAIKDEHGTRVEGFVQDITAMRRARDHSRLLGGAVDATEEAIFSQDLDGVVRSWNHGAEGLYGYTPEEAIGRDAHGLIMPNGMEAEEDRLLERVRAGDPVPLFDTQHRTKQGTVINVAMAMSPILDESRELAGAAIVAHGTRERPGDDPLRLALERQESEVKKLEELSRIRTEFINEAAHELKTPLTPIITHLYLLQSRDDLDETSRSSLLVIDRNATRIQAVVKDLVDASRLEAGRLRIEPRPLVIEHLVETAIAGMEKRAQELGVRFETAREGEGMVEADPERIAQVLLTVLDNAIRFSPDGGVVRVCTRHEDDAVTVDVEDHGLGLKAEQLQTLFEPFAIFPQTEVTGGTGLGLFVSRGIVERHGGTIRVESEGLGRGMTLSFRLPRRPPAETRDAGEI